MSTPADWARAYARQADADLQAWEYFEDHKEAVVTRCHPLLFIQMACEKACKAYLIHAGTPPADVQTSHGFIAGPLPTMIEWQLRQVQKEKSKAEGMMRHVRHLAQEIEVLNPAIDRAGKRPENLEYPWEDATGVVHSPLDWTFSGLKFNNHTGAAFLKLLRGTIDRLLGK